MRLLVDDTDTHRLFMEKNWIGIRRWIIEERKTGDEMIFNGLWYNQEKIVHILRNLDTLSKTY